MREHHRIAIEKLTESIEKDERFIALIIGGSVASGKESVDSDIDVILVATDEEFNKRYRENEIYYHQEDFCDYPGVYIHGKVVNLKFLKSVAERGSEPARDAFSHAYIAFSRNSKVKHLLEKIPVFQKEEKLEKIGKFYAQFICANFFINEGMKNKDDYLFTRGITDLILFGGRLILEHNEILYPFQKSFLKALESATDKPKNLMESIDNLLKNRNYNNAESLYNTIKSFRKWEINEFCANRYIKDTEWAWFERKPFVGDI